MDQRCNQFKSGRGSVSYLPFKYECVSGDDEKSKNSDGRGDSTNPKITRLFLFQALHTFIAECLKPLSDSALEGAFAEVLDNYNLNMHFSRQAICATLQRLKIFLELNAGTLHILLAYEVLQGRTGMSWIWSAQEDVIRNGFGGINEAH